ncbi:hypothetical protein CBA19CS22_11645 [Caballeronia novacaledonica]|uniref:Uncharacterized protein n=1 Tax=Caballeronia novacaledonica TaxID=1544861 RepID=A0ACB5QQ41_9BURK|nr:GIY-YIG nuclease family protein [Caballeronia novacaledonica]GJH12624.1 hypothetical protein CBA19CS11_27320 [Caballeronia novacaledonica]GJH17193.1 hypothetical protein CBA19CS22_11645 [Caballeronia novacaledonica]
MNKAGFVYVLANSAMEGLVKVGKTTRAPNQLAAELSKSTGLPSAFIVVYEQLFHDCHETETFVRELLERRGFRTSPNREFFNAPVHEVVRAVCTAPGAIERKTSSSVMHSSEGTDSNQDELDLLTFNDSSQGEPSTHAWEDIFKEAENHYWGLGDCLEDEPEAYRLFKQAASLGCLAAYPFLGRMTKDGEGVRADEQKALDLFKEGAREGSVYCYLEMAKLFDEKDHIKNAHKCYSMFVDKFSYDLVDGIRMTQDEVMSIYSHCAQLVHRKWHRRKAIPTPMQEFILDNALYVRNAAESNANYGKKMGEASYESVWRETVDFIDAFKKDSRLLTQ